MVFGLKLPHKPSLDEVESASMADRCGNRLDSSPICVPKDASSGPVDVADGNIIGSLEAMAKAVQSPEGLEHPGSSSQRSDAPPLDISNYPDPFQSFGWDRLLPFDLEESDGFPLYHTYLEDFYRLHKNPAAASIADAAYKCLKKENSLRLSWLALKADVIHPDVLLSNNIYECMFRLFQNGGESEAPFFIDAAECIAKEAKLMMKFMRQGFEVPYSQYALSQDVRRWAFKLVMFQGNWSPDIAAVLLGIIKEADLLLEDMSCGYLDDIGTSSKVRRFALDFLWYKFNEIEESDEESGIDDDVLANEVDQPTWGLAGDFEKNKLEKKGDNMDKQPKVSVHWKWKENHLTMPFLEQKTHCLDTSSLSSEEEDLYSMAAVEYL